jgi:hypothetical protein
MNKQKNKRHFYIIGDIIFIIILILLPGIRGYNEYTWYEYTFFVFIPVALLIFDIIKRTKRK